MDLICILYINGSLPFDFVLVQLRRVLIMNNKDKGGLLKLSKIVTGLMIIILCGVLFEAGVVLSDVIVTGQPPHINKLLTSQLNAISSLISSIHHGSNSRRQLQC